MFIIQVKTTDVKENTQNINCKDRADAQSQINILYLRKRIDRKEWNRIMDDILSEPNLNNN